MQLKKIILAYRHTLQILLLGIFSFLVNYHYGFIGIMPMDNTVLYNGGYRILSGYVPFTDYWLVTGPLLDYLNAFFFYVFGVSWKTFIIHSSLFNVLIALASYFLFNEIGLSKKNSLLYSSLISVLFYPIVGTPFVDHHSTFFLIIAFYLFILSVNSKKYSYLFFVPFMFCLSFLSKQTPAAYGIIGILPLIFLLCFYEQKSIKKILFFLIAGSIGAIFFFIIFIFLTNINITNFIEQYILFAGSIGEYRISNYDFDLINIIRQYKFLNFFIIILFVILFQFFFKKKEKKDILIILSSLSLAILLVFHQYLTLNQNFIYFMIPFLTAIIHSFYFKVFTKKSFLIIIISVCIFSVIKFHLRFNEHRKFNELEKVDLSKSIDAEILSEDLRGLNWITYRYPDDPKKEINNLKEIINILSSDKSKKTIITFYQFLSPVLKTYDNSPNQWHHPGVSFPTRGHKFFENYKEFFINSLKKNEIEFIFETVEKEETITELILSNNCIDKKRVGEMLVKITLLKDCLDFQ